MLKRTFFLGIFCFAIASAANHCGGIEMSRFEGFILKNNSNSSGHTLKMCKVYPINDFLLIGHANCINQPTKKNQMDDPAYWTYANSLEIRPLHDHTKGPVEFGELEQISTHRLIPSGNGMHVGVYRLNVELDSKDLDLPAHPAICQYKKISEKSHSELLTYSILAQFVTGDNTGFYDKVVAFDTKSCKKTYASYPNMYFAKELSPICTDYVFCKGVNANSYYSKKVSGFLFRQHHYGPVELKGLFSYCYYGYGWPDVYTNMEEEVYLNWIKSKVPFEAPDKNEKTDILSSQRKPTCGDPAYRSHFIAHVQDKKNLHKCDAVILSKDWVLSTERCLSASSYNIDDLIVSQEHVSVFKSAVKFILKSPITVNDQINEPVLLQLVRPFELFWQPVCLAYETLSYEQNTFFLALNSEADTDQATFLDRMKTNFNLNKIRLVDNSKYSPVNTNCSETVDMWKESSVSCNLADICAGLTDDQSDDGALLYLNADGLMELVGFVFECRSRKWPEFFTKVTDTAWPHDAK